MQLSPLERAPREPWRSPAAAPYPRQARPTPKAGRGEVGGREILSGRVGGIADLLAQQGHAPRSWVVVFVHAVAEAHQAEGVALVLGLGDKLGNAVWSFIIDGVH